MRKKNPYTGELQNIRIGGLYSALPIPAYRVLGRAKEFQAQRVLVCLISFQGSAGTEVFPSYDQINKSCGIGRNQIRKALDVLVDYGFVKIFNHRTEGNKERNLYYIQECVYKVHLMQEDLRGIIKQSHRCLACAERVTRVDCAQGPEGLVHFGCGGHVVSLRKQPPNKTSNETTATGDESKWTM
jgi:Fe2+ or Zn2+ uptake regulation protein